MNKYNSSEWTTVAIPRDTHARIKHLADENGMKVWCVVDKHIPQMEDL